MQHQVAGVGVNLPNERHLLRFGIGIAAIAYVYWTVEALRLGLGWGSEGSMRAGMALGAMLLVAVVVRIIRRVNER